MPAIEDRHDDRRYVRADADDRIHPWILDKHLLGGGHRVRRVTAAVGLDDVDLVAEYSPGIVYRLYGDLDTGQDEVLAGTRLGASEILYQSPIKEVIARLLPQAMPLVAYLGHADRTVLTQELLGQVGAMPTTASATALVPLPG